MAYLSQQEKIFLKENKHLLEQGNFEGFYTLLVLTFQADSFARLRIMEYFLEKGIDVVSYFKKRIPDSAFEDTKIEYVVVPNGVEVIGLYAFNSCRELQTVILPDTLKHIRTKAFTGCKQLKELHLPKSLESIGENAFDKNTILYVPLSLDTKVKWKDWDEYKIVREEK